MTSASYCHISHPIAPVWDTECKILILGSFPSVRSRDIMFFYGHPQNRFWRVCASVFETEIPQSTEEKIKFLLSNSATPFIKELYKDYIIDIVSAKRSVNSKADKRGEIEEVLIRNYDINTEN